MLSIALLLPLYSSNLEGKLNNCNQVFLRVTRKLGEIKKFKKGKMLEERERVNTSTIALVGNVVQNSWLWRKLYYTPQILYPLQKKIKTKVIYLPNNY